MVPPTGSYAAEASEATGAEATAADPLVHMLPEVTEADPTGAEASEATGAETTAAPPGNVAVVAGSTILMLLFLVSLTQISKARETLPSDLALNALASKRSLRSIMACGPGV